MAAKADCAVRSGGRTRKTKNKKRSSGCLSEADPGQRRHKPPEACANTQHQKNVTMQHLMATRTDSGGDGKNAWQQAAHHNSNQI
jgi:hypothetical protein